LVGVEDLVARPPKVEVLREMISEGFFDRDGGEAESLD
jgi:hypothetical protein